VHCTAWCSNAAARRLSDRMCTDLRRREGRTVVSVHRDIRRRERGRVRHVGMREPLHGTLVVRGWVGLFTDSEMRLWAAMTLVVVTCITGPVNRRYRRYRIHREVQSSTSRSQSKMMLSDLLKGRAGHPRIVNRRGSSAYCRWLSFDASPLTSKTRQSPGHPNSLPPKSRVSCAGAGTHVRCISSSCCL
jgi:hypothetical protein